MYCSKCGKDTEASGKYCQWCGVDLSSLPPRTVIRKRSPGVRTDSYGGAARRLGAFIIDIIFLIFLDAVIAATFGLSEGLDMFRELVRGMPVTDRDGNMVTSLVPLPIATAFAILLILVPWIYSAGLLSSRNQATLGMIATRLALTDMHGNRATFARCTLRHFVSVISFIVFCIGYIMIIVTRHSQGLHDIVAGCLVFKQD